MQLCWPCQMSVVYEEKISFNVHLHSQMSLKMSKCPFLQTFGCKFEVYNTEMQIYRVMTVKHLYTEHRSWFETNTRIRKTNQCFYESLMQWGPLNGITVSMGVSICLGMVSIETFDLDTGREPVSTVKIFSTVWKMTSQQILTISML